MWNSPYILQANDYEVNLNQMRIPFGFLGSLCNEIGVAFILLWV